MKSKTGQAAKMHYEYGRKAVAHTHTERDRRLTHRGGERRSEKTHMHRVQAGKHIERGRHTYSERRRHTHQLQASTHIKRASTHVQTASTHTHTKRAQ